MVELASVELFAWCNFGSLLPPHLAAFSGVDALVAEDRRELIHLFGADLLSLAALLGPTLPPLLGEGKQVLLRNLRRAKRETLEMVTE